MNVNPVSFGRTVKVNAPLKVAEHAADLVNSLSTKKGEARVQQQLKSFFFDSELGRARAIAPYGKTGDIFIVTGEDSNEVGELIKDRQFHINAAKKNYGNDSFAFNCVKDSENARFEDLLKLTIAETE